MPDHASADESLRIDWLIIAAQDSGMTFDVLEALTAGLDAKATAIVCGNVSKLPQYMKSSVMPYVSLSRMAFGMEMRCVPAS